MTQKTVNGMTVITPEDGMRLTDGETIAEGDIYLGKNDSSDNWREITLEEAEALEQQKLETPNL
jgi:hypothetical protein